MRSFFRRLDIDRLLPPNVRRDDTEELRRARVAIYFAFAVLLFSAQYAVTYAADGHYALAAWILGPALLGLFTPFVLRARQPARAAGLYVPSLALLVLTASGYYTGGLYSSSTWWACTIVLIAMLIAGTRVALVVMAAVIAVVLLAGHLTTSGYPFPTDLDPRAHPELTLVDAVMLCVVVLVLAWLFERAKDRMLRALTQTNREMELVLTSVGQGFLCADVNGRIFGHRSAVLSTWFGRAEDGASLALYLAGDDTALAEWWELGWSALADGALPVDVCLDQLPKRFARNSRHFAVEYRAVDDSAKASFVAVISDITPVVETERAEGRQREWAHALDRAMRDRVGFARFLQEANELVRALAEEPENLKLLLHTLKGICGQFGLQSLASATHEVEVALAENKHDSAQAIRSLCEKWWEFAGRMAPIIESKKGTIEITRDEYVALKSAAERGPAPELAELVNSLGYEPVQNAFARLAEHAEVLAERLGKSGLRIETQATGIKLEPEAFGPFWPAFLHALRNAVDHGIESREERELQGKPPAGLLRLEARAEHGELRISLDDDGRGVDWSAIARKAALAGLPHGTPAELEAAFFAEGVSTRDEASEVSGRGVGTSALKACVRALGGRIELQSSPGKGTQICVRFAPSARLGVHVAAEETTSARPRGELAGAAA